MNAKKDWGRVLLVWGCLLALGTLLPTLALIVGKPNLWFEIFKLRPHNFLYGLIIFPISSFYGVLAWNLLWEQTKLARTKHLVCHIGILLVAGGAATIILIDDFVHGFPCLVEVRNSKLEEVEQTDFWHKITEAKASHYTSAEIANWPDFFDHYKDPKSTTELLRDDIDLNLFKTAYGEALFSLVKPSRSVMIYLYNLGLFTHFFFWGAILCLCCAQIPTISELLMLARPSVKERYLGYLLKTLGASSVWFPLHSKWFESKGLLYADDPTAVFFYLPMLAWVCAALVIVINMSESQRKSTGTLLSILATAGSIALALAMRGEVASEFLSRSWRVSQYAILALPVWIVSAILIVGEFTGKPPKNQMP